jgi:hypothetical protein
VFRYLSVVYFQKLACSGWFLQMAFPSVELHSYTHTKATHMGKCSVGLSLGSKKVAMSSQIRNDLNKVKRGSLPLPFPMYVLRSKYSSSIDQFF